MMQLEIGDYVLSLSPEQAAIGVGIAASLLAYRKGRRLAHRWAGRWDPESRACAAAEGTVFWALSPVTVPAYYAILGLCKGLRGLARYATGV